MEWPAATYPTDGLVREPRACDSARRIVVLVPRQAADAANGAGALQEGVQHVVIRQESYVAGTRECPEVGIFTQTHSSRPPVPWGKLGVGDLVYMKWSGGPIVAQARVQRFVEIESCTAERLKQQTFGYRLYELDDYWAAVERKGRVFAVAVYLDHERWLEELIIPKARSRGESWIVLTTPELEAGWLGTRPAPPAVEAPAPPPRRRRTRRTITPSVRFEVFRRDSFTCQYCGGRAPTVILHVDHVVPVVAGGTNDLANLLTACSVCNEGKGARRLVGC